jgi:hypothetical protein
VLDLVNPVTACRRPLYLARKAGFDEIGKGTQTPQHRGALMGHQTAGVESWIAAPPSGSSGPFVPPARPDAHSPQRCEAEGKRPRAGGP